MKCIVYIGDFDLRNENVQATLVKNNGRVLNDLGYAVAYIGVNRDACDFSQIEVLPPMDMGMNSYLELPYTLSIRGLFAYRDIVKRVISYMNSLAQRMDVKYLISYQAPTYAPILSAVAKWCRANRVKYIVNCADLPIFDSQPFVRRMVMELNWRILHRITRNQADGIIAVSKYIERFYTKENRPSIVLPPLFNEKVDTKYKGNETAAFLYAGTPFVVLDREVNPKGMKDRLDKVVELFLQLAGQETEFRFNILGITKEAYVTCVPRHRQALEQEQKIVFYGRKTHSETLDMLTQSDFMVNIRDKNLMTEAGLSTKVVESVSVGTPVVMNPIGDTFDYLDEGITGFALSEDSQTSINLMKHLCALSREERLSMKYRCSEKKPFSCDAYREKISSFLSCLNK